jgi:uncharacterized membrane-anchored protein YhcB (DUF1043 family)
MKRALHILLLAMMLAGIGWGVCLTFTSCRSTKEVTRTKETVSQQAEVTRIDTTKKVQQDDLTRKVDALSELVRNIKFDYQKTVLSAPDSAGRQYPKVIERAKGTSDQKETKQYSEEMTVRLSAIETAITDLKAELQSREQKDTKQTVEKKSPWNPPNLAILAVAVGLVVIQVLKWKKS